MKTILVIFSFMMASSVYAHSKFCPEANLSDEQKTQIKELRKDFRDSVKELNREDKEKARAEFHQTVLDTVAGNEQKGALEECFERRKERRHGRRHKCSEEAGLSHEQKEDWKALRKEFKASVEGLSREERREKRAVFHQQVLDTIPETEEQAEALSQCFEDRKKHRKKHRHKHD